MARINNLIEIREVVQSVCKKHDITYSMRIVGKEINLK